jgi:hypothetical protein
MKQKKAKTQRRPEGLVDEFHRFYAHCLLPFISKENGPDGHSLKILQLLKAPLTSVMLFLLFRPARA